MAVKVKKDEVKKSAEKKTSDAKAPEEKKSEGKKPVSKKPVDKKPVDKKPVDKKEETTTKNAETSSSSEPAKEPVKEKKVRKPKKEPRDRRLGQRRYAFAARLCLEQKYLDDDIVKITNEAHPEFPGKKFDRKEVDRTRYYLKNDYLLDVKAEGRPYHRCIQLEDGTVVPYVKHVEGRRARAKKVMSANKDPLFTTAGINVHDVEQTTEEIITEEKSE